MPLDARLHRQEGASGLAHLPRAVGSERGVDPLAEGLGGRRQPLDRPHLVADEEDRDRGEQHAGAGQPQDENVAVGGEHPVLGGDDPNDALGHLQANIDIGWVAGGVEPERRFESLGQGLAQRTVDRADQGGTAAARQVGARLEGDRQPQGLGLARQTIEARRTRIAPIFLEDEGDITGEAFGEVAVHALPLGVEEGVGDRDLHDRHRQDDDQQAAPEERRRDPPLEHPPEERGPQASGRRHQSGARR